jgi:hypothetical protein
VSRSSSIPITLLNAAAFRPKKPEELSRDKRNTDITTKHRKHGLSTRRREHEEKKYFLEFDNLSVADLRVLRVLRGVKVLCQNAAFLPVDCLKNLRKL